MTPELGIASLSAIVAIVLGFFKLLTDIHRTHELVNSRMDELLELTRSASYAAGRLSGPDETTPPQIGG